VANNQTVVSSSSSGGIGVLGALGVAFVVLKLTGVIDWSWWWVLMPFYVGWAILAVVLFVSVIGVLFFTVLDGITRKRRRKKPVRPARPRNF